jgi:PPOX class probable F420-dependent enzyme
MAEVRTALDPDLQQLLDGTPIAHVATVLSDGAPHSVPVWIGTHEGSAVIMTGPGSQKARNLRRDPRVAISLTPPDNPFAPVVLRGRIVEWVEGDDGWRIVDEIAQKYIHSPYPREQVRVVGVLAIDHHKMGM